MASPDGYLASVELWPATWPPRDWAICTGKLLSIESNPALFSLLGTTFGGDGKSTFGLPDMRDRLPIGANEKYFLGQNGGSVTTTLELANLPQHTHLATGNVNPGAMVGKGTYTNDPTNNYTGNPDSKTAIYGATKNSEMAVNDVTVEIHPTGYSQPFYTMPPFLALNFIICLQGIYPPRN